MSLYTTYQEIKPYLISVLDTNFNVVGVPKLQHIDIYNDQFNMLADGKELPFLFPAILVDVSDIVWDDEGRLNQQGNGLIRFYIAQNLIDHNEKTELALKYLDHVHKALQGLSGTAFNKLRRTRSFLSVSHGNMIVHMMEYACSIWDKTADPELDLNNTTIGLEVEHGGVPDPPPVSGPFIIP